VHGPSNCGAGYHTRSNHRARLLVRPPRTFIITALTAVLRISAHFSPSQLPKGLPRAA
jgi:hypothetical protein